MKADESGSKQSWRLYSLRCEQQSHSLNKYQSCYRRDAMSIAPEFARLAFYYIYSLAVHYFFLLPIFEIAHEDYYNEWIDTRILVVVCAAHILCIICYAPI